MEEGCPKSTSPRSFRSVLLPTACNLGMPILPRASQDTRIHRAADSAYSYHQQQLLQSENLKKTLDTELIGLPVIARQKNARRLKRTSRKQCSHGWKQCNRRQHQNLPWPSHKLCSESPLLNPQRSYHVQQYLWTSHPELHHRPKELIVQRITKRGRSQRCGLQHSWD